MPWCAQAVAGVTSRNVPFLKAATVSSTVGCSEKKTRMFAVFSLPRAPIPIPPTTMASTLSPASCASGWHMPWSWWRLRFVMARQVPLSVSTTMKIGAEPK